MPTVEDTIAFIKHAHAGQKDKAGRDYDLHLIDVMKRLPPGTPVETKLAALLHDILEDTAYTRTDLELLGYSPETIEIVEIVTNSATREDYGEKIKRIIASGNRGAILVKLADMTANTDPVRLARLDPELREKLLKKYAEPLNLLQASVAGHV